MITLEKIDQVVERTGADYSEAKQALEVCGGNVVDAIIWIEKNRENKSRHSAGVRASDIIDTLKEFIRRGNVSRIIVSDGENTLLNLPVTVGAIGIVLGPVAALLGLGAAIITNLNVSILDHNGNTIDLNKVTAERLEFLRKKGEKAKAKAERKMEDIKDFVKKEAKEAKDAAEDLKEKVEEEIIEAEVVDPGSRENK
ncbi:MAG: DUF4342 domain-containing protein [Peptostreptococcaceae bacterium]|nr:DUF4342 domain-containing protein [Peptostreptococcaceae bacterium]